MKAQNKFEKAKPVTKAEGVESSGVAASERKEGRHPCVKMLE